MLLRVQIIINSKNACAFLYVYFKDGQGLHYGLGNGK